MAASLVSFISSLILIVDDPGRDDLNNVLVWASTTNGFTPGAGNLVYQGNGLVIGLSNLDPFQTYYVRYAYVSDIDPTQYTVSAQLSGTPSLIDGNLTVDGTIRAEKLRADAIRGKMLVGSNLMDKGTLTTASFGPMADNLNSGTLSVIDTADFRSAGGALLIYISRQAGVIKGRYSGKSGSTLTGVSGFTNTIPTGSVVVPVNAPSAIVAAWAGGTVMEVVDWWFRVGGGGAIAIDPKLGYSGSFSYTGMTSSGGIAALSGVSGAGSFTTPKIIVDNNALPSFTVPSTGTYTSVTVSNPDLLTPGGGICKMVNTGGTGISDFVYRSISGTTLTIPSQTLTTGVTYFLIPVQTNVVLGRDDAGVIQWSNQTNGHWQVSKIGAAILEQTILRNARLHGLLYPALELFLDDATTYGGHLLRIGNPKDELHMQLDPVKRADLKSPFFDQGTLGSVDFFGDNSFYALTYDGKVSGSWARQYMQPISTTLRFSTWDQPLDGVVLNTSNGTFRFDWGGTAGAGTIRGADVLANGKVLAGMVTALTANTALQTADGLAFPSTQVAVTDPNTLDDYEEGTFTPAITFGTPGNLSVTYASRAGTYTKIGRVVEFLIRLTTSAFTHTTASGAFRITGLPFTVGASDDFAATIMRGYTKASFTQVHASPQAGQTFLTVLAGGSGQVPAALVVGDVPTAGTIDLYISGKYFV